MFDCAGMQASFDAALDAVRTQGNVVEVAVWEKSCASDERGCPGRSVSCCAVALEWMAESLARTVVASQAYDRRQAGLLKIALEDFVEEGIKALIADSEKDTQIKIIVHP
ncbi:sorbitol dehydrogenase [Rhodofomes roseus]|uniref:Sorbitol dehydrogenase n=1 Tax=Rhodofomes roseus TaxID=34475 RepID=A0ABQ8KQE7_9APHY|nr:sorbitol dehydrogenase [Rhodofomes roseus]KAH9840828.1 sorbitol dehydrogenase [Rhodofomes roseus]